ncbi:hypothetical protein [Aquimarina agarivorans]|uniref:hypothetical protein n=1 Tax=Aquimarina agarivorans TaxID=980584 RepID=UPI0002EAF9DF|nr:hypothetical protein [Aquimarina agarivorans]
MNIHEAIRDVRESKSPIIKGLHKTADTKILIIGLKEGVVLKDHKVPSSAKILEYYYLKR